MKYSIYILLFMIVGKTYGQSFLNGDFENNTAGFDQLNLSNGEFNSFMSNSNGFGSFGNLDIITSSTFSGGPQSGNWYVALTGGGTDLLSIELTAPLIAGDTYTISFYDKNHITFVSLPIEIGLSNTNNSFGTLIYTTSSTAIHGVWTQRVFSFVAPTNGQYIVARQQGGTQNWVNIDNFSIDSCEINLNLGLDTTLCPGEALTLNATTSNASYLWQDNSTSPTINVTQQGTYWVNVTNSCGSLSDTINVNFNAAATIDFGNDTTLCPGETLTLNATTSNATYLWQDNSTNPTFNVTQQGTYWVNVTNSCGSLSDTINVNFNAAATIDLGLDTTLYPGETLTLNATTSNATYLWQDNSITPTFNVTQQGTYWVNVTNSCGSLSDTIIIQNQACEITLEIPNVFTPNNDGINDLFAPIISKKVVSMNTIIYNRWGNKVYETNKLLINWNGGDVSDGTYFWIIYYTDISGVENKLKGHVTILR